MIKPIKDLGQNFLRNREVILNFIREINLENGDSVFEIGPGEGVITLEILKNKLDFKLTSIDIDERSIEELSKIKDERFNLIHKDILKFIPEIPNTNYKIVGAIPYNITSPIIHRIVEKDNLPKKVILIVQDEVARKIVNKDKSSYFTFFVGYFFDLEYIKKISRNDFYPIPKVDSAIISFTLKKEIENINKMKYSNFLHKVFRSPRKKINKVFDKDLLNNLSISSDIRPENLTLEEVIKLFKAEKES